MTTPKPVAVIAGAGPGNGAALARRFIEAGYAIALLSRHPATLDPVPDDLSAARSFACDVTDPISVERAFASIRSDLGVIDVLLYNAGSVVFADVETITFDQFEQAWQVNAYGALLCSRQVIPGIKDKTAAADNFHRRNGIPTRQCPHCGVCTREGCAAQSRRVDGPTALARRHPRCTDRDRWGR